jgi:outer membrane protein assembly factor BamA
MADLNFDSGVIRTNFNLNNTFRFIIDAQKNVTLNKSKKIVSSVNTKIGLISNDEIDDFFHFFGGGMPGIKGYTFYDSTLTGPYLFVNSVSMRWPLILEENIKFLNLNLQNMSLGGVFQAGGAFNDDLYDWIYKKKYKLSAGIELRLSGYSFYAYPIAVSYELHKPINDDTEPLKSYFSILFDF